MEPEGAPIAIDGMRCLLSTLSPKELVDLLRSANEPYVYEETFAAITGGLPPAARDAAWALLSLSRDVGRHVLLPSTEDRAALWFTPTPAIVHWLHDIDVLAKGHLETVRELHRDERRRLTSQVLMDGAVAACLTPDEYAEVEDAREFLRHGRAPESRTERLVTNFYFVMQRVPEIAQKPVTIETVLRLQRMLSHGIATDASGNPIDPMAFRQCDVPDRTVIDQWPGAVPAPPSSDIKQRLQEAIRAATMPEPWVHPVIAGIIAYFSLESLRPFELGGIGLPRALFQVFMHRAGYPTMQLMPVAQVLLWRYETYGRQWPVESRGDLTGFLTFALEAVWQAVSDLAKRIDLRISEQDLLREQLRFNPDLNHRQRTIIGRAIRLPGATFHIDYHRRSYEIAYSTARADLQGLVDCGYLQVHREGHGFVFTAEPNLRQRIAART